KQNQTAEIARRVSLGWAAFGKLRYIIKDPKIPINLKRKVYRSCILPVTTYGLETMTLTQRSANSLRVCQRAMERSMLGISLRDRVRNDIIRSKTGVPDIVGQIAALKWRWAGHVARCKDERWNKRLVCWTPRASTRSVGRPQSRWHDDIRRHAGSNWLRVAQERETWK
ncbi:Putative uncharacterized transposon-derived protein F52C9.6, partial [Camponotus floridanus]